MAIKANSLKMEPEPGTNVAQAAPQPGSALVDYSADAGSGLENVGAGEQLIPFYRVLQPLSPECADGALKPGLIINTATKECYESLTVIPAVRDHNYAKFTPLDAGGGFKGLLPPDDPVVADLKAKHGAFCKLPMPDGDELVETFYLFSLLQGDTEPVPQRGVLAFDSTDIKIYKQWISRVLSFTVPVNGLHQPLPIWAHRWRLSSIPVQKKTYRWFIYKMELLGGSRASALLPPNDPLYVLGRDFWRQWRSGGVKADYAKQEQPEGDEAPF